MEKTTCILCNSKNIKHFKRFWLQLSVTHTPIPQDVVQCQDCGFMFVNPLPTEDEIARLYADDLFYHNEQEDRVEFDMEPEVRQWEEPRYMKQLAKVVRYVSSGKMIDIGCGCGVMLRTAQKLGWNVHGLELSKACVELCRDKWHLNVQHGSILQVKYPEESFELVVIDNVFEHLISPECVLEKVRMILKPKGILLISVPNILGFSFRCWFWYIKARNIPFEPKSYGHLFFYTMPTIISMLEKNGFIVKEAYIDQAPHLGGSKGVERILKKLSIYFGKYIRSLGNQITVYAMKG